MIVSHGKAMIAGRALGKELLGSIRVLRMVRAPCRRLSGRLHEKEYDYTSLPFPFIARSVTKNNPDAASEAGYSNQQPSIKSYRRTQAYKRDNFKQEKHSQQMQQI
jgi:hypothetical protein